MATIDGFAYWEVVGKRRKGRAVGAAWEHFDESCQDAPRMPKEASPSLYGSPAPFQSCHGIFRCKGEMSPNYMLMTFSMLQLILE